PPYYASRLVAKSAPYRSRFGELVGRTPGEWTGIDPGFFDYAIRDAVAVHRLYPALAYEAMRLMREFGFDPRAERYDIHPDAVERFGYLSEVIQVKASVALAYLFRNGVRIDLGKARELEARDRAEMAELVAVLERDHRDVLTYPRDGNLKLAPRSRAPSLGPTKLVPTLTAVVRELEAAGHQVCIPRGSEKNGGMSRAAKEWAPPAPLHPLLDPGPPTP